MIVLGELGRAGDCFTLCYFGDCGEFSQFGLWCVTNDEVSVLSFCDAIVLVPEASTEKYLVEFFWDELFTTNTLFFVRGVSWAEVL